VATLGHPNWDGVSGAEAHSVMGTIGAFYVPTPNASETAIDLTDYQSHYIRIQAVAEDLFYVFTDDATNTMVGLTSADFKFDETLLVPMQLGEGFSDDVVVPMDFPILLLRSASGVAGEARVHRL